MSEKFGNDGADYDSVPHMRCEYVWSMRSSSELWSMCGDDNRMARAAEAETEADH